MADEKPEKRRCVARNRQGQQCKKPPEPYQLVCRQHGGASPQAKAKAEERRLEDEARRAIATLDIQAVDDPLTALKWMAGEVIAWKNLMSSKVDELMGDYRYGTDYGEQLRAEVALFERAMDRCVHVLATIAKLGIDDRLAAVTERQAQMMEDALFAAFDEAGVGVRDTDTRQRVVKAFSRHLVRVS
jgi:hypothetical protein